MLNRRKFLALSAVALTGFTTACARFSLSEKKFESGPGKRPWQHTQPELVGLSEGVLNDAATKLSAAGERQGIVVVRHGKIAFEKYWANDWALAIPEWKNVSFSSGKSWGSTMVGRAITEGKLGVDDLASQYYSPKKSGLHPQTTIKHLLTMSSGGTMNMKPSSVPPKKLSDKSPAGVGAEYEWYQEAEKGTPPGYGKHIIPGEKYFYDGAPADHLANIISVVTGKTSYRYMMEDVVAPLGCEHFEYQSEGVDTAGNVRFGGSILISCRDMARLGQLYLNGGRWNGEQLISEHYIRDAISASAVNPAYGYLWWLNYTGRVEHAPTSMYFAAGARGQFCFVLPEQDMVIATMGFGKKVLSANDAWEHFSKILPVT
ncbi:MAG: beta-lactamase family protein [Cellvibrionaceae bacterium]